MGTATPTLVNLAQTVLDREKDVADAKEALHLAVGELVAATAAKDPMDATPAPSAPAAS